MAEQFDRVAIIHTGATEYVVLDTEVVEDFGHGQGPLGGVVAVNNGWVSVKSQGEARLYGGAQGSGGNFPPSLRLAAANGTVELEIAAYRAPTPHDSAARVYLEGAASVLRMQNGKGKNHALLEGATGNLWLGGEDGDGDVVLFRNGEKENHDSNNGTVHLDGDGASVVLRRHVKKSEYRETFRVDGKGSTLTMHSEDGDLHAVLENGNLWLGGKGSGGDLVLFKKGEKTRDLDNATLAFDGDGSNIIGRNLSGERHCQLEAGLGNLWLGGKTSDGDIALFAAGETDNLNTDKATIHLNGNAGDIILRNGDCAEEFDIACTEGVEPGTVMVIMPDGRLCPSQQPYDRTVAGVISGAGNFRPAIVLDRQGASETRRPVALVGKVYCKVDATSGPIRVGDLLTTSAIPGHAMRADDPARAFGAVMGKALGALDSGTGLIPILVTLQ